MSLLASKGEILAASRCFPLFSQYQTFGASVRARRRRTDGVADPIAEGRAAWQRIKEHGRKNFDDWIKVAWALAIGRTDADLLELLTDAPARQTKAPVAAVAHAAA